MTEKSRTVLRASNLINMIKTICILKNDAFSLKGFQEAYLLVNGYSIGEKTAEDYFYTATQVGLVKRKGNMYHISKVESEILCGYLENNRTEDLNELLFNILKSKIEPFRAFLHFLEEPRNRTELNERFNQHSAGTMLKWGKDLGIVDEDKINQKYFLLKRTKEPIHSEKLWKALNDVYQKERRTHLAGIESAFVKIPDLRETVRGLLGISGDDFDECLKTLLTDDKYAHKVELSGAPIIYIEKEQKKHKYRSPLLYRGKKYYFLAIHE